MKVGKKIGCQKSVVLCEVLGHAAQEIGNSLARSKLLYSQGQSLSHCETFMAPPRGDTRKVTFERAFGLRKKRQRAIR